MVDNELKSRFLKYLEYEKEIMNEACSLWEQGLAEDATNLFSEKGKYFKEKIELAKALINSRPLLYINFFEDYFFLRDMDPIEVAMYFTHEQIIQLFTVDYKHEIFFKKDYMFSITSIANAEKFIRIITSQKYFSQKQHIEYTYLIGSYILTDADLVRMEDIFKANIKENEHQKLVQVLFEIVKLNSITEISYPFQFSFIKESKIRLETYYERREIEKAILYLVKKSATYNLIDRYVGLERLLNSKELLNEVLKVRIGFDKDYKIDEEERSFSEPIELEMEEDYEEIINSELEREDAYYFAEKIFLIAEEKGLRFLRSPIHINFDIDEVEDIVANYPLKQINEALIELNKYETVLNKENTVNTLDTVRKYVNGRIEEETEEMSWREYAPKSIVSEIKNLRLENAYEIVLAKSKDKSISDQQKKEIMSYRFELEEIIFGAKGVIEENPYINEDFKEYPFEQYVRNTVEAIILPHVETLAIIRLKNGEIHFVDIWTQHFSDELKNKVKTRDGYKCVICDEESNLHVHHKIPRKYGGVNHMDNLVTLCSSCHGAIETADFEHAYKKCMLNAIKLKTTMRKQIDTSKELYLLKEEILVELDQFFVKIAKRDELLGQEILQIMKKVEYVFEQN